MQGSGPAGSSGGPPAPPSPSDTVPATCLYIPVGLLWADTICLSLNQAGLCLLGGPPRTSVVLGAEGQLCLKFNSEQGPAYTTRAKQM